ncbi:hypothetical protein D2962_06475 [Biomaibacter acetigenes]|uniref:Uncharacterized protein n=1 Tax=Biomaibacter acetigenes TaxID=2316383 RepID=A0A3G2R4K8_9FIRM|nr:hypothetical protein [Biomaibacter acetigenes]AYO30311.1 hypothetical protein D2962_06475 [Biomaibacter acetigenes]RKL62733.1 hypothetical protein DXT63_09770 [Thermoanaerobacteraceae bacterium SP2]
MVIRKLLIILLMVLFLTGCSQNSSNLIYNKEKIDMIDIQGVNESNSAVDYPSIQDLSTIKKILSLIDNIKVRKLSPSEENKILDNGKKMQQKGNYFISFLDNTKETSPAKSLCGLLIILKEGKLIFSDIKTMTGKQRTVSYIPVDDVSDTVDELLKIIENR